MVSKNSLLRNIRVSGGLFSENILLRLRDNPELLKIGKIKSFIEDDKKQEIKKVKDVRRNVFEWCVEKWDEISPKIDKFTLEELIEQWLFPFFSQFNYELEDFEFNEEIIDEDNPLAGYTISHQSKGHENPFFQFVNVKDDLESKTNLNPRKNSHHTTCQQFINLNPVIKWLFLSNGRILRILTKYYHTYSKGYLEFDLENIFANRDKKEFDALYAIIHPSRFVPKPKDHEFLIEEFQKESVAEGIKIGDALRDNVHDALELLGNELIQQNPEFLDLVMVGDFDKEEYYAELLRIIYRIIFILYAEQREMLPGAGSIYFEGFSLSSIRMLAEKPIKVERNYDLWNKLFLTFNIVGQGNKFLEINAYDGGLFYSKNLKIILKNELKLSNDVLLMIIRLLTTTGTNNIRQRINFLEIKEEEIGAIYESLLDFKPYINKKYTFQLIEGTERKSTGSYYTPRALIDILIRTTLQPLVEDRLKETGDDKDEKEKAILDLKVCDPACGGGTFLLSALDYLGKKLAEVRTGSDSPLEDELREARREILQHCIYGVDMNPLAVELAKMSLWLRACVKDKPLNFLDNHIKCGNSLIGLGQKTEISGIEPDSFKAISGNKSTGIPNENTKLQNMARKIIRDEIKEQKKSKKKITTITAFMTDTRTADICSIEFQKIIDMSETKPEKIKQKEIKYEKLRQNENYQQALNEANIWTSTFYWPFEGTAIGEIPRYTTIEQLRNKSADPWLLTLMEKINNIAGENQFFHWFIEFPEVFSSERKGFDCILTNPPWEEIQLKEMEFFESQNDILNAKNQSERRKLIKELKSKNKKLHNQYVKAWRSKKKISHFLRNSGYYPLSSKGTGNTFALFTERVWRLISAAGYAGIITPTAIITNYHLSNLFQAFVENNSILNIFDFENKNKIFDIITDFRFCLISLCGKEITQEIIPMTFYTLEPEEIQNPLTIIFSSKENLRENIRKLPDDHILIPLEKDDFKLFNPNTLTCPSFKIKKDADLLRHLYQQTSIFRLKKVNSKEIISNPWKFEFKRHFDMSNDSELFLNYDMLKNTGARPVDADINNRIWIDQEKKEYFPLYEGRMISFYNHRLNSMEFSEEGKKTKAKSVRTTLSEYINPYFYATPNYWIEKRYIEERLPDYDKKWFLGFRSINRATRTRTFIFSVIPYCGVGNSLPLILVQNHNTEICGLIANLSSIIIDYIIRQKISGPNLSFFFIEQVPIFPPNFYNENLLEEIKSRVIELVYTSYDLKDFAKDIGYEGKPFKWDMGRRAKLQSELDAIYAHLYNISREDLIYILETFPVLKKKELEKYNEYHTKLLILEAFDKFGKKKELFKR